MQLNPTSYQIPTINPTCFRRQRFWWEHPKGGLQEPPQPHLLQLLELKLLLLLHGGQLSSCQQLGLQQLLLMLLLKLELLLLLEERGGLGAKGRAKGRAQLRCGTKQTRGHCRGKVRV